MMTFGVLAALAIVLMIGALAVHRKEILLGAALFWFIAGLWARGLSSGGLTDWDLYYGLFFICSFGMTIACIFIPSAQRDRPEDTHGDVYVDDIDETEEYADKLNRATRIPRIGRNASEERSRKRQKR